MSNEENSIIRFGDDTITALNFIPATNYVLAPHGSPVWEGSADDLAALVRDARRFRKLVRFSDGKWGTTFNGMPLEQLADALPEVEQK